MDMKLTVGEELRPAVLVTKVGGSLVEEKVLMHTLLSAAERGYAVVETADGKLMEAPLSMVLLEEGAFDGYAWKCDAS
jgi:hypothetical protein